MSYRLEKGNFGFDKIIGAAMMEVDFEVAIRKLPLQLCLVDFPQHRTQICQALAGGVFASIKLNRCDVKVIHNRLHRLSVIGMLTFETPQGFDGESIPQDVVFEFDKARPENRAVTNGKPEVTGTADP